MNFLMPCVCTLIYILHTERRWESQSPLFLDAVYLQEHLWTCLAQKPILGSLTHAMVNEIKQGDILPSSFRCILKWRILATGLFGALYLFIYLHLYASPYRLYSLQWSPSLMLKCYPVSLHPSAVLVHWFGPAFFLWRVVMNSSPRW